MNHLAWFQMDGKTVCIENVGRVWNVYMGGVTGPQLVLRDKSARLAFRSLVEAHLGYSHEVSALLGKWLDGEV